MSRDRARAGCALVRECYGGKGEKGESWGAWRKRRWLEGEDSRLSDRVKDVEPRFGSVDDYGLGRPPRG